MNQTALQAITRGPLYWAARRICHDRDLPPEYFESVFLDLVQREFLERIKPFVDMQARTISMCVNFSVYPTGIVRHYSPAQQEILDECDKQIRRIAEQVGEANGIKLNVEPA